MFTYFGTISSTSNIWSMMETQRKLTMEASNWHQ